MHHISLIATTALGLIDQNFVPLRVLKLNRL